MIILNKIILANLFIAISNSTLLLTDYFFHHNNKGIAMARRETLNFRDISYNCECDCDVVKLILMYFCLIVFYNAKGQKYIGLLK